MTDIEDERDRTLDKTKNSDVNKLLPSWPFNLASENGKAKLPSVGSVSDAALDQEEERLTKHKRKHGTDGAYWKMQEEVSQALEYHLARVDALIEFLETCDLSKRESVQKAAEAKLNGIETTFGNAMKETLKAQRLLERNVRSIGAFFMESGCEGQARSVFLINQSPTKDDMAEALGEVSLMDIAMDPHPLWGRATDPGDNRTEYPVTFIPIESSDFITRMCAVMGLGANIEGKLQMQYIADKASKGSFVAFANVDPEDLGPNAPFVAGDGEGSSVKKLEAYTDAAKTFRNVVAVANPIVARRRTEYEDADVCVFPAFPLLGKVYRQEKVDSDHSFTDSPIGPRNDIVWAKELACPSVLGNKQDLEKVSVIFVKKSADAPGDGIVHSYNSSCTAWSTSRFGLEKTLGHAWLRKVVTHHLEQAMGSPANDAEARSVGQALHMKLANLSGPGKPFEKAWVDWTNSKVKIRADGKKFQFHKINVELKEGVEEFSVEADLSTPRQEA